MSDSREKANSCAQTNRRPEQRFTPEVLGASQTPIEFSWVWAEAGFVLAGSADIIWLLFPGGGLRGRGEGPPPQVGPADLPQQQEAPSHCSSSTQAAGVEPVAHLPVLCGPEGRGQRAEGSASPQCTLPYRGLLRVLLTGHLGSPSVP